MPRLSSLLLANNNIARIARDLHIYIPNLKHVVLSNNKIASFVEIYHLSSNKSLQHVSLTDNPISFKPNYRKYAIYCMPFLKTLDYTKVTNKEREEAKLFFNEVKEGMTMLSTIEKDIEAMDGVSSDMKASESTAPGITMAVA